MAIRTLAVDHEVGVTGTKCFGVALRGRDNVSWNASAGAVKEVVGLAVVLERNDACAREVALIRAQLLAIVVRQREQHVVAVFLKVTKTSGCGDSHLLRAGLLWREIRRSNINARVGRFGDEVHHTGDGVRTVQRRCTVGEDFNSLNGRQRQQVQVNALPCAGQRLASVICHAATIEQHQRALRSQTTQRS